jgi:LPS-assembly protein
LATRTRSVLSLAAAAGLLLLAASAAAQVPSVTVPTREGDITVIADRIEDLGPEGLVLATGNVEITRGAARLTADRVEIDRETGDVVATGRVTFQEGEDRVSTDRIDYNFRTGTGVMYDAQARAKPYYRLSGERLERLGESLYRVRKGVFTTCEADPPPWSVRIGTATADLEDFVWGTNASFWVLRIPLIPWVPFFAAPIRRERQTGFLFPKLGTSSQRGVSAEIPFYWAISDSQDATVGLLAFERRGFGLTGEYRYVLSGDNRGLLRGFFLTETRRDDAVRAWGQARHDWTIAPGLTLKADVTAVTDDDVLREYADRLQERGALRVESHVFLTRNWASWSAIASLFWYQDLTTRRPIELNRLPDLSLHGVRQPVPGLAELPVPGLPGLLWEFDASAVRFAREIGSDGTRVDVRPRLSRPISLGYATLTPFAGGRVTGYDRRVTGVRLARDNILVEETAEDLRIRQLLEVGGDLESVASRPYRLGGWQGLDTLVHSIEPRVNYTRIDGRNMDRLPAWTELERLEDTSRLEYSLTNRIRGRTLAPEGAVPLRLEMLRLVLGHSIDVRKRRERSGDLVADLLLQTTERLGFRGDLRHDTHGRGVQSLNTDVALALPRVRASVGTRYNRPARISFLQGAVTADVTDNVTGRLVTNWDLRANTFVENRVGADIRFQCYSITVEYINRARRADGRRVDDEVRVAVNLLGIGGPIGTSIGLGGLLGGGAR